MGQLNSTEQFTADLSDEQKLEIMRLGAEHARVYGSKMESMYVIAQREAEIKRIRISIEAADKRLVEIAGIIAKINKGV